MPHLHRRTLMPLMAPVAVGVALAGCGGSGGNSDKDKINSIVKAEGRNPAAICQHASAALLAQLGGSIDACTAKASGQPADPSVKMTKLTIKGARATAVVVDKSGTTTVIFVKQGDSWVLA